ncbi:MAG TPA: hypothetical protein DIW31_03580, partial [Bacteroidales bacterium]|nr:hypothetical protein [Bacteroidales bacterium]
KGAKGGFAVGGLTGKEIEGNYYLQITPDSARINITSGGKGAKGGFAVGGLTGKSSNDFFRVTSDTSYFTTTVYTESNIVSTGTVQTGIGVNSVALTDIDGNIYKTVKIGSQVWMKENLKVTKYSDGTALSTANEVGNYNFVSDASDTIKNYGRIYSYNVVLSPLNVCPTGWHVPTDADWNLLLEFVGGVDWSSNRLLTGLKLMEKGTISGLDGFWDTTINKANDLSGFSARPGGLGDASASWSFFSYLGTIGYWWSVTSPTSAQVYSIDSSGYLDFTEASNLSGYSVRCVKDF